MIARIKAADKTVLLIVILAFLIRMLYNIFYIGIYDIPASDAQEYNRVAQYLLDNGIFCQTRKSPLFPFFLAFLYEFFGVNYFAVRIVLSILSSVTCVLIYLIAKKVFNVQVAYIAAFIYAIYWKGFYFCGFLLTETLFTLFLMLFVLYLIKTSREPLLRYFILGGLYFGLGVLARPFILPFFLLIPFWALITFKNNLQLVLKGCGMVIGAMFLVILPWTVRNYVVENKFTLTPPNGGQTFLGSNNPEVLKYFEGGWIHPTRSGLLTQKEISDFVEKLSIYEADKLCWKKGINFVLKNPLFTLELMYYKFKQFWHLHRDMSFPSFQYWFVFLFAVYGSIVSLKKFNRLSVFYLLPLFFTLMILIFNGDERFRYPLEPILVIFAACGIAQILEKQT
jgi:4-amino-4-deoxy-L-arabinose transferase-like glycosyltransferase